MPRVDPTVAPAATRMAPPHPPNPPRPSIRLPLIDPARCTGCGRCVGACGPHLLSLEVAHWKKSAVLHDAERCTGCSLCERRCPFGAITMARPADAQPTPPPDFTNSHNPCAPAAEATPPGALAASSPRN